MDTRGPWTGHLTKPEQQMSPTIEEILSVLNRERVRATYGAVADVIGVSPRSLSRLLGERRPEASWVVAKRTLRPTGYADAQIHPDVAGSRLISSGDELRLLLKSV